MEASFGFVCRYMPDTVTKCLGIIESAQSFQYWVFWGSRIRTRLSKTDYRYFIALLREEWIVVFRTYH